MKRKRKKEKDKKRAKKKRKSKHKVFKTTKTIKSREQNVLI